MDTSEAEKPATKVFIFRSIFERMKHFDEYHSHPVQAIEKQGYHLCGENDCFKTFVGGSSNSGQDFEYVCLIETPAQDYLVMLPRFGHYLTFLRNFAMLPRELFERLVPQS